MEKSCSIPGCTGRLVARGWCTKHYQRWRVHGSPTGGGLERPRLPLAERFWLRVDRRGPDECWPWLAAANRYGYGSIKIGGRTWLASRIAYGLASGEPVPADTNVCHRCDNPSCVNPAHLFLGSQADNMRDCAGKGRLAPLRGEQHPHSRLTAEQVRTIRRLCRLRPKPTDAALGEQFGVSEGAIRFIRIRRTWNHLDG